MAASRPQYASTSLYVGDLSPDVTETVLYEFFNSIGPVASIRVCRDSNSRKSLRYAYVNYHSITDAERALETLNYTPIKGNPCRIMWSQRDPTTRKSTSGNLFVRNLDRGVDNRALHDTFSLFGNILSCKVVTDEQGRSKGYGFVHFELDEAAQLAVERVNGMKIGNKNVYVGPFQKRGDRPNGRAENYTNIYTKSFPPSWDENKLKEIFGTFGQITSVFVSSDSRGRPFACINYAEPEQAKSAVQKINGSRANLDGLLPEPEEQDDHKTTPSDPKQTDDPREYVLYVDRAQDRSERIAALKAKHERTYANRSKYEGVNLYIKNLGDHVDDQGLRALFEPFGTITSAKVMRDEDGHSKGFGFVCFTTPEEATKALAEMHLKLQDTKPLYVGLAEQKDRRQARLQSHFKGTRPAQAPLPHPTGYSMPYFSNVVGPQQPPITPWAPQPTPFPRAPANYVWKTPSMVSPAPVAAYPPAPRGAAARRVMPPPVEASAKQIIGEQLFPKVQKYQPDLAGKITGMMLDMDESELRVLLESDQELKLKIDEAIRVLEKAQHVAH